jgi:hypothetical protein
MHFPTCSDNLPIMFPKFPTCSPLEPQFSHLPQIWTCITHKGGGRTKGEPSTSFTSIFWGSVCNVSNFFVVMGQSKWLLAKRQNLELWGPSPKLNSSLSKLDPGLGEMLQKLQHPSTSKEWLIAKALLETLQDIEAYSNTCPSQKQQKETKPCCGNILGFNPKILDKPKMIYI